MTEPSAPVPGRRSVVARGVAAVGWLALLAIVVGLVVSLVPLRNGIVQACGAPAAFLIDGRSDVYPDAGGRVRNSDGRIVQLSPGAVKAAIDRRCSRRVGDRMVRAGALLVGGGLVGVACVLVAAIGSVRQGRRNRDRDQEPDRSTGAETS